MVFKNKYWIFFATVFSLLGIVTSVGGGGAHVAIPKITSLSELSKHVGTYPCVNRLLENATLLKGLRDILGKDYVMHTLNTSLYRDVGP